MEEDRRTELWENIKYIGDGGFGSVSLQKETSGTLKTRAVKKVLRRRTTARSLSRELDSLIKVRDVSIKPSHRLYPITSEY